MNPQYCQVWKYLVLSVEEIKRHILATSIQTGMFRSKAFWLQTILFQNEISKGSTPEKVSLSNWAFFFYLCAICPPQIDFMGSQTNAIFTLDIFTFSGLIEKVAFGWPLTTHFGVKMLGYFFHFRNQKTYGWCCKCGWWRVCPPEESGLR